MKQNDQSNYRNPGRRFRIAALVLAVLFSSPVIGGGGEQHKFGTGKRHTPENHDTRGSRR